MVIKNGNYSLSVVGHTFNPSTQEAEAGGCLSLRPPGLSWVRLRVPGQPGLHRETLFLTNEQRNKQTAAYTAQVKFHDYYHPFPFVKTEWVLISNV